MSLELRDVWYTYQEGTPKESVALQNINLTIQEGEFLGIVGHTGSGKSTLIQHMNGLLKPTRGSVYVDGADLHAKEHKRDLKKIRMQVGIVFQYPEYQLFEETVEKDIAFGPLHLGLTDEEVKKRVKEAMRLVGLDYKTVRHQSPFALSGGQKRKVAIAGVLAMKPKYLILDEPAAGLDPKGREELLQQIANMHRQGMTVVMVTHSMDDIARYADRMLVLHDGTVALDGTPEEIFENVETLRTLGIGVPTLMRLLLELRNRGWDIRTDLFRLEDVYQEVLRVYHTKEGCRC